MVKIQNNLGIYYSVMGNWLEAEKAYRHALKQAEKLGSVYYRVLLGLNLGVLQTRLGDDTLALHALTGSLQLAKANELRSSIMYLQSNLVELYLRREDPAAATEALRQAEDLAHQLEQENELPAIYCGWAQLYLLQKTPERALEYANKALAVARRLEAPAEEGTSLRVLGQTQAANGHPEAALTSFEQSYAILTEQDPYEAARTQTEWGRCLLTGSAPEQGAQLLQNAGETFAQLGARRDLAMVEAILGISYK